MITEDYVSFETAKLLKEKGFKEITQGYINADQEIYMCPFQQGVYELSDKQYPYPTLQMACKWLREVHNLHCGIDYDFVLGWYCQITSLKETVEYDNLEMKHYHPDKDNSFSSSEEACEVAIKYCLENLI